MLQIYPAQTTEQDKLKELRRQLINHAVRSYSYQKIHPPKRRYGCPKKSRITKLLYRLQKKQLIATILNPIKKIFTIIRRGFLVPTQQLVRSYFFSFFYCFRDYKIHIFSSLLLTIGIIAGTGMIYTLVFQDLPNPEELVLKDPRVTTRILDRNGEVLFRLYEDENRTLVRLSEIPLSAIQATIAIEDKDFYNHHGFSIRGISRAIVTNFSGENESIHGGSTLTQQLVKNRLLTSEKSYIRKAKELILAVMVENRYTKGEILEMYLNQVAYGGTTYGIEEAAMQYFGKHARQLTLAESALIAGLPKAPSVYSPFGANPGMAKERQKEVLRRMTEDGYISAASAEKAITEELRFRHEMVDIKAPHFVMYVKKLLAEQYGDEVLHNGGLIIQTSLDLKMQDQVQEIVSQEISKLNRLNINNGAALVTNPQTGEILAMVGSANYFDFENDGQVNVTIRPRQPGSSIKPLTYALGLENGLLTTTRIDDRPITFNVAGSKPYSPQNYDGRFHGRVTVREALASSYNVPAVKLLALLGVDKLLQKGKQLGISTWEDVNRFGLSLTLGGGEVLMTDMATMYGVFANHGNRVSLNPILKITDYHGKELYYNHCALDSPKTLNSYDSPNSSGSKNCDDEVEPVLDPGVAYIITSILSDNEARTPAFGPMSTLVIPNQDVAVKTGTTNNLRDNWTIGYTSDRVVAVWVGNNNNTPMSYVASGITGASPIWNQIMRRQLNPDQPHHFEIPGNVALIPICNSTRQPACNWCQNTKDELFLIGTEPRSYCNSNLTTSSTFGTPNTPIGRQIENKVSAPKRATQPMQRLID